MNIIFEVDGGIGKSIAATAVCKAIKRQYPEAKLIVLSGYPEVFDGNPNVHKALGFKQEYFYRDYIQGQKSKMFLFNPYLATDFINREGHLIKVWCEMFGIPYNGEQPEMFLNDAELNLYGPAFASQKPIMGIQTNGGAQGQFGAYSWARDIPAATAQKVVDAFAKDYNIVHFRREDQLALKNTTPLQGKNIKVLATLVHMSQKGLYMDSFAQHLAAAMGKPAVVCWIANTPEQFGYKMHTNILASPPSKEPLLRGAVFSKYNIAGDPAEFPYNRIEEIFDAHFIIEAVKNTPVHAISETKDQGRKIVETKPSENGKVVK